MTFPHGSRHKRRRALDRPCQGRLAVRSKRPVLPHPDPGGGVARMRAENRSGQPAIEQAASEGWLNVVSVATKRSHPPSLGIGEVEAIQLALETEKALLIMDDRLARREATRRGLDYIGTVRMLHLAEQRSMVDNAEATIQRMAGFGYRISPLILRQLRAQTSRDEHYSTNRQFGGRHQRLLVESRTFEERPRSGHQLRLDHELCDSRGHSGPERLRLHPLRGRGRWIGVAQPAGTARWSTFRS